jgi:hypothetical protein
MSLSHRLTYPNGPVLTHSQVTGPPSAGLCVQRAVVATSVTALRAARCGR